MRESISSLCGNFAEVFGVIMQCPACNYFMSDFDTVCPRCQGKGLQKPTPPVVAVTSTPVTPPVGAPPVAAVSPATANKTNSCFGTMVTMYLGGIGCLVLIGLVLFTGAMIFGGSGGMEYEIRDKKEGAAQITYYVHVPHGATMDEMKQWGEQGFPTEETAHKKVGSGLLSDTN